MLSKGMIHSPSTVPANLEIKAHGVENGDVAFHFNNREEQREVAVYNNNSSPLFYQFPNYLRVKLDRSFAFLLLIKIAPKKLTSRVALLR